MNKKGFTLIELLATIVLLAIVVAIAIPAVNTIFAKNKKNSCDNLKASIIRAAEAYISDNKYNLNWHNYNGTEITSINYSKLYNINSSVAEDDGYLNNVIVNPCTNEKYMHDFSIGFKKENGEIKLLKDDFLPNSFNCCK